MINDSSSRTGHPQRWFLILGAGLGFVWLFASFWPLGSDYFYTFRPVPEAFFHGKTRLYDEQSIGYYNLPWSVFLLYPTLFASLPVGQALILTSSVLGLLFSVQVVAHSSAFRLLILTMALANLHTFDLLIRGNIDGFLSLGLGLGWLGLQRKNPLILGAGLWLLSIKPVNVILPGLVLVYGFWAWPWRQRLLVLAPLAITIALSLPLFGLDWPMRYWNAINAHPPFIELQTSLWRVLALVGVGRAWAYGLFAAVIFVFIVALSRIQVVTAMTFAAALVINLVFSPYTLGSHYVLLAPVLVLLAQTNPLFMTTWLLTFTPLARLFWGQAAAPIDSVYPIALMLGLGYVTRHSLASAVSK
jgi:hypothetical protein